MCATKNARRSPTPRPKRMPSASEYTLRAKKPIRTPARTPFKVEPTTMPRSIGRAAGVNQAVSPSKMPRIPPRMRPYTTLFMILLRLFAPFRRSNYYSTREDFPLAPGPQEHEGADQKVRQNQDDRHPVPFRPSRRLLQNIFWIGSHGEAVQIARDVL